MGTVSKILVIDDEPEVLFATSRILKQAGYCVLEAATGKEALQSAKDHQPDLILLDVVLPGIDGFEVCRILKSDETTSGIHIIFITGKKLANDDKVFGLEEGADDYILRPINNRELLARVKALLRLRNAEKELENHQNLLEELVKKRTVELRESEDKYRSLFENSPLGMGIADGNGNILDFNNAMLKPGGYTREDISQMGNLTQFYCDFNERTILLKKAFDQGFLDEEEVQFKRKDGKPYDALLSLRPIQYEGKSCWQATVQDITERKQTEYRIQKAQREWENIFQAIGNPTLILDGERRLIHANSSAEKAMGKPETDVIGKSCYEIFHNTDEPPEGCPFEKMTMSGHLETIEMEVEALGGSFLVSCTPMLDEKGRIEKVIHIATDINDRKQAEEALRQSEQRFHLLFDNTPIGYQSLDQNGRFLDVNQAWLDILGYKRHEVIGKWFGDFLPPELGDIFREKFKQNMQSQGLVENVEFPLVRKDGSIVLADYMARIGRDKNGRFLRTHCVFSDITEKKRTEQALRDSEEKYRELVENINDVIVSLDATGTVTYISPTIEAITGTPPSEVIGRHMMEFIDPDDRVALAERFRELVQSGCIKPYEYRIIDKSGNRRWARSSSRPIIRDGKIAGVQGVLTDITQTKEMEEQLRQAHKMEAIATLAGGIAHDYNNLLAVIMGNLSLAQEETDPHSVMGELLHEIEKASHKARNLTHQFLTLSKGGHPRKESGTMESLLKEIPKQVQTNENIEYIISIRDDLWPVKFDSKQMHYAISNVLTNAVEAMPQGGKIAIDTENQVIEDKSEDSALLLKEGKYVKISIKDEGKGIAGKDLDRIFDPYFSTKERGVQKGMGLGLTTAYAVVQKHGGHIVVKSTTGVGTTVTIYLPAAEKIEKKESIRQKSDDATPSIGGIHPTIKRILVMDDEEGLRTLAQWILGRLGYEVETVKDGAEAIETYKKHMDSGEPFDGVILDLTIKGGMGGDQAIKELIKIDPGVRAIVCSGYFNDPVLANYEEHGFRGAMAKPFQKSDLESALKKALG